KGELAKGTCRSETGSPGRDHNGGGSVAMVPCGIAVACDQQRMRRLARPIRLGPRILGTLGLERGGDVIRQLNRIDRQIGNKIAVAAAAAIIRLPRRRGQTVGDLRKIGSVEECAMIKDVIPSDAQAVAGKLAIIER
ncbi:MAG TPA: hypothetical protein DDZ51_11840, partial [Planctomycetaceae bacterium]|nr:hypothetical protein [Planctomycetaceae bacterium]